MSETIRGADAITSRLVELLEDQTITSDQFVEAEAITLTFAENAEVEMSVEYNPDIDISIKANGSEIWWF